MHLSWTTNVGRDAVHDEGRTSAGHDAEVEALGQGRLWSRRREYPDDLYVHDAQTVAITHGDKLQRQAGHHDAAPTLERCLPAVMLSWKTNFLKYTHEEKC